MADETQEHPHESDYFVIGARFEIVRLAELKEVYRMKT